MVAEVGLMEVEEDNIMEEEEEEKLHNNKLYKDSVEEEKLLFKKFVAISKLCSSDTAKIPSVCVPRGKHRRQLPSTLCAQILPGEIQALKILACATLQALPRHAVHRAPTSRLLAFGGVCFTGRRGALRADKATAGEQRTARA